MVVAIVMVVMIVEVLRAQVEWTTEICQEALLAAKVDVALVDVALAGVGSVSVTKVVVGMMGAWFAVALVGIALAVLNLMYGTLS